MEKYNTTRFGEIELNDDDIIHFPTGLYGFEKETKFILIPFTKFIFLEIDHVID